MMAGGISIDPDAVAFLAAAGITDGTITSAINNLVISLKSFGIWTKLKAIYPFVGGTASTHKFNLKNPVDTNAAFRLVFSGGWTHSANGIQGNGTNAYADTFYVPNAECDSLQNSMSFYSRTQSNLGNPYEIFSANNSGNNIRAYGLLVRFNTNQSFYANGAYNLFVSNSDSRGFFQAFTDLTNQILFRNSSQIGSIAIPNNLISGFSLYIGGSNGAGTAGQFSNKQCAFASMGGTKLTTTEAANYYTAVQAFQTTLGRQV
jgi:hypothetical protein